MYSYQMEKNNIHTDDGQRMFLKIRDNVESLLAKSGAVTMDKAIQGNTGDSFTMIACIDRMVELGELREISQKDVLGQNRIFVSK